MPEELDGDYSGIDPNLSQVKCICIAHFMDKTIQSALHKIKALGSGRSIKNT